MNRLIIRTTEQAETDISEIGKYIAKDNKIAAKNLLLKIRNSFLTLAEYPNIGTNRFEFSGDDKIYFFTVQSHYLIVYTIDKDELLILRVLSAYQNICEIL